MNYSILAPQFIKGKPPPLPRCEVSLQPLLQPYQHGAAGLEQFRAELRAASQTISSSCSLVCVVEHWPSGFRALPLI